MKAPKTKLLMSWLAIVEANPATRELVSIAQPLAWKRSPALTMGMIRRTT